MKCPQCAGKLYQAYLTARLYVVLGLPFVAPVLFGAFMPLPWALGATALYVAAGSQLVIAAGKVLINRVSPRMWRETSEQIAALGGGVEGIKEFVHGPCDDAPVPGILPDDEDGPEPPPSAPGGEA